MVAMMMVMRMMVMMMVALLVDLAGGGDGGGGRVMCRHVMGTQAQEDSKASNGSGLCGLNHEAHSTNRHLLTEACSTSQIVGYIIG